MKRAVSISVATALLLGLGGFGYTKFAARILSGTPPEIAAVDQQADLILVDKSDRTLTLLRSGKVLVQYPVSLGARGDSGHKRAEGDEKTPEGIYQIDWRNEKSVAYLSLHISYPNDADRAAANTAGYAPGGDIMIHGLPNGWGFLGALHLAFDWTNGCIGVDNSAMQDIWARTPTGTKIEIRA